MASKINKNQGLNLKTNYIKKLTKKVYFYAIDDTKPSTYG